ncbi:peptidylprolyl isomerase [Streptomyces sp. TS71-3]|uniref:peptidylprolyl isomerase n=1 Tax=Streptomyces sp. TS71-3 TaxID=2733862 RepID=UPI001B22BBB3|nr:peptidylprolyl isomerase [Streptomyces sp. TS71-3]GHJ38878.1 peptidyl-prolyl cis-trans isomerase [Streptomyces sp. TS71-3]
MVSSDQRRRQLAREKFLRQQQRRESARLKARRRNAAIAAGVVVVVAIGAGAWATDGFGSGSTKKSAAGAEPSAPPSPSKAPDPCEKPAKGTVKNLSFKKEPAITIDKSATYTMDLKTTCGDMPISMAASKVPHTVNSFDFLAKKGYFDHTKCHRLTTSGIYVLQCGDPKGNGTGGPGYTIPDEDLKDTRLKGNVYPAGTVAMANQYNPQTKQGKNSGGSQFFLVFQDSQLPPYYTPFGTLSKDGMKVLTKIAKAGESTGQGDGAPNATVVINKATVQKS